MSNLAIFLNGLFGQSLLIQEDNRQRLKLLDSIVSVFQNLFPGFQIPLSYLSRVQLPGFRILFSGVRIPFPRFLIPTPWIPDSPS